MKTQRYFSYDKEREYYSGNWPQEVLGYDGLEDYLSSWLGPDAEGIFRGKRVLDIGAGEATYTRMIAKRYAPELIVALDLFHERLHPAFQTQWPEQCLAVAGDCFKLPFGNEKFDVVFGSLVLHQLPDIEVVAEEVYRVLKPGGVYVGVEPNFKNPFILARFAFGKHSPNQYLFGPHHILRFAESRFDVGTRYFYWKWPRIRSPLIGTCIGLLLIKKNIVLSADPKPLILSIVIPSGKRSNLIFRAEMSRVHDGVEPKVGRVITVTSLSRLTSLLRPWWKTFGIWETIKMGIKISFGHRYVAAVVVDKEIASYAWLYSIQPYDFPVDKGDCILALVSTRTFYRGLGLAEILIKTLMNTAFEMGHKIFFIETSYDNNRMLSVIRKCGPWQLVGSLLRLGPQFLSRR